MDFIVLGVIILIVGLAARTMIKQKKNGGGCHGCGSSSSCPSAIKKSCPSNKEN